MPAVHDYRLAWDCQRNTGIIQLRLVENGPVIQLPIESTPEFLAAAALLSKAGVEYDPAGRRLRVPYRRAGT